MPIHPELVLRTLNKSSLASQVDLLLSNCQRHLFEVSLVVRVSKFRVQDGQTGGYRVQGQPGLHEANKKKEKKKKKKRKTINLYTKCSLGSITAYPCSCL